jgi:hypothetical protein
VRLQWLPFQSQKGEGGETLGCHLMRGKEAAQAALQFNFFWAREGNHQRRAAWWRGSVSRGRGKPQLGRFGLKGLSWARWKTNGKWTGCSGSFGPNWQCAAGKTFFKFIQGFWIQNSKIQILLNQILNWDQTKIKLNKLFEDFSNLDLKIDSNIQIQTKALNGGLLIWFRKRFQNEIGIFSKSEINLGLRKKCMQWNATYQFI